MLTEPQLTVLARKLYNITRRPWHRPLWIPKEEEDRDAAKWRSQQILLIATAVRQAITAADLETHHEATRPRP